jgi:lipopolysaccharide/colanic/teichoic acid biosynthesis glycosyltransferase
VSATSALTTGDGGVVEAVEALETVDPVYAVAEALRHDLGLQDVVIRILDIAIATLLLVLLLPLLAIIALAIRLDSPGSAIFRQRRVGRGEDVFTVLKFRTMRNDAGEATHRAYVRQFIGTGVHHIADGTLYKLVDDRITAVGRVLRKTSLDELPQLWNVVRGQMSLVGPRPVVPYEAELYPDWYHRRFQVLPGLTGLWQISGRSLLTYEEMVALDIEYVRRRSLALYLIILVRTVPALLFRSETA